MRSLHALPPFRDRWSYMYFEYGELDQQANGLVFSNKAELSLLPINQVSVIMLGPGTTVTHSATKVLAGNNCLLAWTGEEGIRLYAHSTGGTFSSRRTIHQARMFCDESLRLDVVKRMYGKRFPGEDLSEKTIEQIRGMEGYRVRESYRKLAEEFNIEWRGRNYDQTEWYDASPANRALSAANACLYGITHAAIVSAGYSAALGFVHVGKMLSFVYDIADLYKTEITVPLAFRIASTLPDELERTVRKACRTAFHDAKIMNRILPDIAEVLDAGNDLEESVAELEGRAVSMAVTDSAGGVPWKPEPPGEGRTVEDRPEENQDGQRDADLDLPW